MIDALEALNQLAEAPPFDEADRLKLVEAVRARIASLEADVTLWKNTVQIGAGFVRSATESTLSVKSAPMPSRHMREAEMWFRGTSLSIRLPVEDMGWAEELREARKMKPGHLRIRPRVAGETDALLEALTVKRFAIKAYVGLHPVDVDEAQDGDILVEDAMARNVGGHDPYGRSPVIAFGVRGRIVRFFSEPTIALAVAQSTGTPLVTRVTSVSAADVPQIVSQAQAPAPDCPHDNVASSMPGQVICMSCGATLVAQRPTTMKPPLGFVEVQLFDESYTAVAILQKKLAQIPGAGLVKEIDRYLISDDPSVIETCRAKQLFKEIKT